MAGAIIGAFLGGLIWGALGTVALKRTRYTPLSPGSHFRSRGNIDGRQKIPYHDEEDDAMGWPTRRPIISDDETKGEEDGVRNSAILTGGRLGHEPPITGRTINQASLPSPT